MRTPSLKPWHAAAGAVLLIAAVLPAALSSFNTGLLALWLPLIILAISLDLLWGENRIISFGHGAFFAAGAYIAGLLLRGPQADATNTNYAILDGDTSRSTFASAIDLLSAPQIAGIPVLAFVLAPLVCGLAGALVGSVIFRVGSVEIYAPLITLGVGVIAATVFLQLSAIGGSNGLSGIPPYTRDIADGSQRSIYFFNAAWLAAVYLTYTAFRHSRHGRRWRAAGDDPVRLEALGSNVRALRTIGFAASTALAGLAGALYVGASGFISAETAGVVFSVQAFIWLAVGGSGTLLGPLLGVLAIQLGNQKLSEHLQETWQLLLGALLILVVLVAPAGLTGLGSQLARATSRRAHIPK